jgi:CMP-N-acetylneuraminic acid synthetase
MKKVICIIPAQDKNNYSSKGDLCQWGESTLLDWKISQLKEISLFEDIYVYTSSKKIIKIAQKYKEIKIIKKSENQNLFKMYKKIGKKFKGSLIMWANPTSPFISKKIIISFINLYKSKKFHKDGIVTSEILREYFLDKDKKTNSFIKQGKFISRNKLHPIYKITNGLYLSPSENYAKGIPFGESPIQYPLKWINALEIKSINEIGLFNSLIFKYLSTLDSK